MLRFMADEYDDTCSTVFPFLQTILGSVSHRSNLYLHRSHRDTVQYKRARKSSSEPLDDTRRSFLSSLLSVILQKLKWEEDADPEDMDEDDKADFEELRKVHAARLHLSMLSLCPC